LIVVGQGRRGLRSVGFRLGAALRVLRCRGRCVGWRTIWNLWRRGLLDARGVCGLSGLLGVVTDWRGSVLPGTGCGCCRRVIGNASGRLISGVGICRNGGQVGGCRIGGLILRAGLAGIRSGLGFDPMAAGRAKKCECQGKDGYWSMIQEDFHFTLRST